MRAGGDAARTHMAPSFYLALHSLPTLPSGKPDRLGLQQAALALVEELQAHVGREAEGGGDGGGGAVAALREEIGAALGLGAAVAESEAFVARGGTSVLAAKVAFALRQRGWDLPPEALLDADASAARLSAQMRRLAPPSAGEGGRRRGGGGGGGGGRCCGAGSSRRARAASGRPKATRRRRRRAGGRDDDDAVGSCGRRAIGSRCSPAAVVTQCGGPSAERARRTGRDGDGDGAPPRRRLRRRRLAMRVRWKATRRCTRRRCSSASREAVPTSAASASSSALTPGSSRAWTSRAARCFLRSCPIASRQAARLTGRCARRSHDEHLYALGAADGATLWRHRASGAVKAAAPSLPLTHGGAALCACFGGRLAALDGTHGCGAPRCYGRAHSRCGLRVAARRRGAAPSVLWRPPRLPLVLRVRRAPGAALRRFRTERSPPRGCEPIFSAPALAAAAAVFGADGRRTPSSTRGPMWSFDAGGPALRRRASRRCGRGGGRGGGKSSSPLRRGASSARASDGARAGAPAEVHGHPPTTDAQGRGATARVARRRRRRQPARLRGVGRRAARVAAATRCDLFVAGAVCLARARRLRDDHLYCVELRAARRRPPPTGSMEASGAAAAARARLAGILRLDDRPIHRLRLQHRRGELRHLRHRYGGLGVLHRSLTVLGALTAPRRFPAMAARRPCGALDGALEGALHGALSALDPFAPPSAPPSAAIHAAGAAVERRTAGCYREVLRADHVRVRVTRRVWAASGLSTVVNLNPERKVSRGSSSHRQVPLPVLHRGMRLNGEVEKPDMYVRGVTKRGEVDHLGFMAPPATSGWRTGHFPGR